MDVIQGIGGIAFGFWFSRFVSDPFKLKNRLPVIHFRIIELLPNFRIRLHRSVVHIHHWIFLTAIFGILLFATSTFSQLLLVKSLCLGGIIHGFTFKDRFTILTKI